MKPQILKIDFFKFLYKLMKEKKKMLIAAILMSIPLILWIAWANTALVTTQYTVSSSRLPEAFSGFRIAHISDLHNTEFGDNNEKLLSLLKHTEPNIIVITGDLLDSRRTNIPIALSFAKEAVTIAPVYYCTGNHESRIYVREKSNYNQFESDLKEMGVQILRNQSATLEKDGEHIQIIGLDDPDFYDVLYPGKDSEELLLQDLKAFCQLEIPDQNQTQRQDLSENKIQSQSQAENPAPAQSLNNIYTILLSHRPELFETYQDYPIDLIFSGHTHGGQFRLPFLGGILAPHQGFFPIYDGGLYTEETSQMVLSRGLGNSLFPFRINNRPEIILVELKNQ